MNYIEMIYDAIQYIESNLLNKFTLEEFASRYHISPMHFYRIFRAVTNQTVRSYVLERRLSLAAIALRETEQKVVDIAFQYGFSSHEQFSRAFKKMFQVSPSSYRKGNMQVSLLEKADIIERSFKNKNKDIIVDFFCQDINEIKLLGKDTNHNPECPKENEQLVQEVASFFEEHIVHGPAKQLFTVNGSTVNDPCRKSCFYGIPVHQYTQNRSGLTERTIPQSKYAVFVYPKFMAVIFRTVIKDIYKGLELSGCQFNKSARIDFIELFTEDYEITGKFHLYIPVL